jgi:hypothetical protein
MKIKEIAESVIEAYKGSPKLFQYFVVFCFVVAVASAIAKLF